MSANAHSTDTGLEHSAPQIHFIILHYAFPELQSLHSAVCWTYVPLFLFLEPSVSVWEVSGMIDWLITIGFRALQPQCT
jgi:hypothetical protein